MNLPTSWDVYSIKLWFQCILQWLRCFKFDLWIPEDWTKGSVATTARGGEMPNITVESVMAFVLAHTVIHNKLLKFQNHVLRVTWSKTCPTNWSRCLYKLITAQLPYHPMNIWWGVQIIQLIMQLSSASLHHYYTFRKCVHSNEHTFYTVWMQQCICCKKWNDHWWHTHTQW